MRRASLIVALAFLAWSPTSDAGNAVNNPPSTGGGSSGVSSLNGQTGVVTAPLVEANATALAAQASAGLSEGAEAYVVTLKAMFVLQASTTTPVALVNVAASGKTGYQWIRQLVRNPVWEQQTAYWVDPQNGAASDEATCTSSGAPCASLTELSRRLANAVIPTGATINVTLVSSCATTDKVLWTLGYQPGAAAGTGLVITGVPTVIYTGTVTGFVQQVQGSVATATDNELTDSTIPTSFTASGLLGKGLIFQRTNGTAGWWWALKDLGSKALRMSDAMDVTSSTILALAVNDTYTVSRLPKIYDQSSTSSGRIAYVTFVFVDDNSTTPPTPQSAPKIEPATTFDRCTFSVNRQLTISRLRNCAVEAASFTASAMGVLRVDGGAFVGTTVVIGNSSIFVQGTGNTHFQGGSLNVNGISGGATTLSFYDSTSGLVVVNGGFSILNIKGLGNTGKLMRASDFSAIIGYSTFASPPCVDASSSDAAPVQAGDTTVPGTSISCTALPLTTQMVNRGLGVVPF